MRRAPLNHPLEGKIICNLKSIMDERRLTIAGVSRIAHLSRPTVRNLRDNDFERVDLSTLAKICDALNVGIGVLLTHKPLTVLMAEEGYGIIDDPAD